MSAPHAMKSRDVIMKSGVLACVRQAEKHAARAREHR